MKHLTKEDEELIEGVAEDVIGHIDWAYPDMWKAVARSARISIRNTVINKLRPIIRNLRDSEQRAIHSLD